MAMNQRPRDLSADRSSAPAWNDTRSAYPHRHTLSTLFDRMAAACPEAIAVAFRGRQVTYASLQRGVDRWARELIARGIGPGARVGVCVERSVDMLAALLGVLKSGAAYVPLDPAYPRARVELVLQDAGIGVLLTQRSLADLSAGLEAPRLFVDDAHADLRDAEPVSPLATPAGAAYVIYTSGSTGTPKGVVVSNRNLVNFLHSMRHEPGLTSGDVVPAITTISFDIATLELFLPLIVGARLVLLDRDVAMDGRLLADAIDACGATMMQATPATWRMLLDAGWPGSPCLRALCGGEALTRDLADRLLERCQSVWNMYGPTETTVWSAVCQVEPGSGPVPIGHPIANTQIYVLDGEHHEVPIGGEGEIWIGGDGVACGYLNRADLTADRFLPDPFASTPGQRLYRTGDLGRRQSDGTILFGGRADHQVKIRGHRIELGEIEDVLSRHARITQAVVVALNAASGEKQLAAYYATDTGREVSAQELKTLLRQHLPDYMVPASFACVPSFPLTPNGKVDRQVLMALDTTAAARPVVAPRTAVERVLVSIWAEALGIASVGVMDDFFDLGGHSLIAVRVFAQIARRFGRNLPLSALVGAPTIARLALLLEDDKTPRWDTLVTIQPFGTRRPLFIVHGGGGTVLFMRDLAHRLGTDRPVYGLQCEGLDGHRATRLSVEAMAAHYLETMRAVQPRGPYLLAGYCYGGIVAFEMAQQLQRQGDQAALVALLNAPNRAVPASTIEADHGSPGRRRARAAHRRALGRLRGVRKAEYLARVMRDGVAWRQAVARRRGRDLYQGLRRLLCALYLACGRTIPQALRDAYVLGLTTRAERAYRPHRYDGRLVIFRGSGLYTDASLGWGSFAARVDTREIGGVHRYRRQIMQEPAARELAEALRPDLDRAEDEGQ